MEMHSNVISQFPLFANLPPDEIAHLAGALQEHNFGAGEILFNEGSLTEYFFFVLDGEVEVVKSLGTADERVLALSRKGSILGEMSMFSREGGHTASARALTPLKLLRITFQQFNAVLHRHPDLAYDLLRLYSRRLVESESQMIQDLREKNRQLTLAYQELKAAQVAIIEKEKLEHELQIAAEIQRGILPETLPSFPGLDFGALMIPARQVGGDFYDFIPLAEDRLGIVIGDVCDKGIPAALFMALTYSSVRTEAFRQDSPGSLLQSVNRHLLQVNRTGMFVTLLYGVLDCRSGEITYARAGHPAPLVLDASARAVPVPYQRGQPLGLFDSPAFDEQRFAIPPGGTLLAFSDGLSETVESIPQNPPLPEFCASVLQENRLNAQSFCDALWRKAAGEGQHSLIQDDFTVVSVQRLDG